MYAQIDKSNMTVTLVGGEEIGLPIVHPMVLCIDIEDRTDVVIGMLYDVDTGNFSVAPVEPVNAEAIREQAYESMLYKDDGAILIPWHGVAIAVDQANKIYSDYAAENSPIATEIQSLIIAAKTYIRSLYPDATSEV